MTLEEFKSSLRQSAVPSTVSPLLQAMWYAGKDNWEEAHNLAQDVHTTDGSWAHAYLHRQEGDLGNASYWYHRAGRTMPKHSLEKEWEEIVNAFLKSD